MKVCTCLVLFRILAHTHSLAVSSAEESQVSAEQEEDSVLEESSDDNQDNNDGQYTVQSFTLNDKTDIKSNLKVIYRAPGLTFTGFIEEVINILDTFEDTTYIDVLRTLDTAVRKYHYKGCKFSEVTNKYDTRKFLASTLKMAREQPISVTRANINGIAETIKSKNYDENLKELLEYINSLYLNAGDKLLSVVDSLEQFKISKSTMAVIDLSNVIKNGVRTVLFDYYTNLNFNTRRELKHRIDTFWRRFKQKLTSRRESKAIPQSKAINNVKNSKNDRNAIKKFKPVSNMERNKNLENKKEYIKNYSTRTNQNRFENRGSDYKTTVVEPKQGMKYDSSSKRGLKHISKYESSKKSITSDPLISVRNRDSFRRNIETTDSLFEVDLYQYGGVNSEMNLKQDIELNTAPSEISEEQIYSKSDETFKNSRTAVPTKSAPSKSLRDRRQEMEAELMKPTPQISFYLSTNLYKFRPFTLPQALKTHYNFGIYNDTTEHPISLAEIEVENKFKKDTMQRTFSSAEKDTHVIKRIKSLETQLKKVKNKVNIVNSEVVKIKKVLFKNNNDAKGSKEAENFGSRAKLDFNTSPDDLKVTNQQFKTTETVDKGTEVSIEQKFKEDVDNYNEIFAVTKTKEVSQTEDSLTKHGFGITPIFKAKEKSKKKVTIESQAGDNEKFMLEPIKATNAKDSSEVSINTSIESSATTPTVAFKSNMAVTTSETLAKPVPTKVNTSSQSLTSNVTKTPELNTSIDINDGKASNNYVIRVY